MTDVYAPGLWMVEDGSVYNRFGEKICTVTPHVQDTENANLIASAPDMQDALYEIMRFIPCHCYKKHGDNEACPILIAEKALNRSKERAA